MRSQTRLTNLVLATSLGGLGTLAGVALVRRLRERTRPRLPSLRPLDELNERFHQTYDDARQRNERRDPVLVVLADSLILFRGAERHEARYTPRLFQVIKSVAHAPLAIFSVLHRLPPGGVDTAAAIRLMTLHGRFVAARESLDRESSSGEPATLANLRELLERSIAFVEQLRTTRMHDPAQLSAFAADVGPALLRSTDDATRLQLAALNREVERLLARLSAAERRALQVVVTGDHQARVRSLAMQYFQKLFGEPPGVEHRVTYAEGVSDEKEALALVGTRRLDRAIASAFFADSKRLQRDILGDAVHQQLADLVLPSVA